LDLTPWIAALEVRHLSELRLNEVTRALRALSADYVERRHRLSAKRSDTLAGKGKRAAFALFYGPLHFLTVREIVRAIDLIRPFDAIVDLGCGTGAAGAAWASLLDSAPRVIGVDRQGWMLDEAALTYRHFGAEPRLVRETTLEVRWPRRPYAVVAAYTVNELEVNEREQLLDRVVQDDSNRASVLIVEPIAKSVTPWWSRWAARFEQRGGHEREFRFRVELPAIVRTLDHAAGLDHHELTARALWL
jgi:hypothetical protein